MGPWARVPWRQYLLTGLFVTVPIGVSLLVVVWFITFVDQTAAPPLDAFLGVHIPGIGLLTAFLSVLAAGVLASHVVGQTLLELGERVILVVPGLNWLYRTIKQIVEVFSPENPAAFRRVVLVEHPKPGSYSLGFVTKELQVDLGDGRAQEMVSVYIPTNHFYLGDFVMFPVSAVHPTPLTVQQGIQCALSAGAAIPERLSARGIRP